MNVKVIHLTTKTNVKEKAKQMKQTEWVMIPLNKVRRFALWREAEKHEFVYSWGNTAGTIINVLLNTDEIGTDEAEFLYEFIRLKAERAQKEQGK